MTRRRVVLLLVLLAVIGLDLVLLGQRSSSNDRSEARTRAAASAVAALPLVMSYSYSDLDRYAADVDRLTTGTFRDELTGLIASKLLTQAKANQVTIRTTVQGVGVVSATADRVMLVAFVDQWRTTKDSKTPVLDANRLAVTVTWTGDRWLVSALRPR